MSDSQRERYRLERKISGKGGFGDVWLATDTLLDRPVAVKCPKATDDPIRRERFLVEARMLARLNHSNITQIHDAFFDEEAGNLYLVMEYVDGRDLSDIIQSGTPLPLDIILEVAVGVLQALSYAHGQGIVHRDVKPANVMIADDVKLTDFGLATLRSILDRGTGFIAGTPAYMAPEQVERRAIDGRADLYALGILLFEMLSGGCLPFEHSDPVEMLNAHLRTTPPRISQFAPTVPPVLEQVVTRLLAKDPAERYSSAEAVIEVLESIHVGPKLTNLPVALTPFVGREAELAGIQDHLGDPACRLLTLVGPGGCGKTRLAVEAASAQIDHYPHGVFFVSLAPVGSVDSIVPTVAEALGFRFYEEGEPQQQLLDYLRQKHMLLILDNFEHLVEGAGLVTDILQTAPEVKILVTSRARLKVGGEHLFPIDGMHFPRRETEEDTERYSAVRLFLQSAHRVRPGFEPTGDDMMDIARICHLVEGMPLAILLATAWMEILSPAEIAAEIRHSLDFLEADLRDVPERQRSMRAVFDHTWDLLTEREREVLHGLSVFRGGFTRKAAREITGASLPDLMALVHKSLVYRTAGGRYDAHDLIRQYAAEKLEESPATCLATRDRHSDYFTAELLRWKADLRGPRQQTALAEMDAEIENVWRAWDWAMERPPAERLDRSLDGLCHFLEWRGRYQEGEAVCRGVAEKLGAKVSESPTASGHELLVLARALSIGSSFNRKLGHAELASQLVRQCLTLLERSAFADQDTELEKANALLEMGRIAEYSDLEEARRLYTQSVELFRALGDRWGTSNALINLGFVASSLAAYGEAKQLFEESLAIGQMLGDRRSIADSLTGLGDLARIQGQHDEAESLTQEVIAICQDIGYQAGIADGFHNLGVVLLWHGRFAKAHSIMEESLAIYEDLGRPRDLAFEITSLGFTELHLGRYEGARAQGRMGLTLAREIDFRRGIGLSCCLLGEVALAEEAYVEAQPLLRESVTECEATGQRRQLGWALSDLGHAVRGLGQPRQAAQYLCEVLRIAAEIGAFIPRITALPATALLLAGQGKNERAVELYALASRYPFVANSRWFEDIAGKHITKVAATLPPELVEAAKERGRARDLEDTVAELLAELECQ